MNEFIKRVFGIFFFMVLLSILIPLYQIEIFFGWLLPTVASVISTCAIFYAQKKGPIVLTKMIAKGFIVKMVYYGIIILLVIKHYAFQPIPFVCSLTGFFMVLHVMEAIVIKHISELYTRPKIEK